MRNIGSMLAVATAASAALLVLAPAAHADPKVQATVAGNKIEGNFAVQDSPAFVFGLTFNAAEQGNETGIACPGARSAPSGPGGAWECLFSSPVTTANFLITGRGPWPSPTDALLFVSFDNATYKTYPRFVIAGNPVPNPARQSTQPSEQASAAASDQTAQPAAISTAAGHSLTWLWWVVIGVGVVVTGAGIALRRTPATVVDTQVAQPELPPPGGHWRDDESVAIDAGLLEGFAAMGRQDTPATVSDDVGPVLLNPDAPSAPYSAPSEGELAAARQWGQDLALERDQEDPQWHLHNAHRTPNKGLAEFYAKLEQVNALIAQLEGPQGDSVVDHDWLENTWHEYSTIPLTSSDPLQQAYQWREQLQGLIQLYLGKGGAQAVNLAINEQKNEMLVNTINMESDMAHGTAIGATSGALANTQAGYHPEPGDRVSAPKRDGGTASAGEGETGFAPEPETIKMTPEQQGIKSGNPAGIETESPTVHDGAAGAETQTLDPTPKAVPDADVVTFEAGRIERTFQEFEKTGGTGDSYSVKTYERWLREQPPEWWDKIDDPGTKAYLRSWLAR